MISSDQDLVNMIATLTLMFVVALAVRQDLVEHRISNWLTFAALAAGLLIHTLFSGLNGLVNALAGAGVGAVCLLPLYLGKGMGAGDVKMMGVTGAFLGPLNAFVAALLSLVIGAVLAIVVLVWRMIEVRQATAGAPDLSQVRKERFPYAVAVGLGAIATMWLRGMFDALLGGGTTP